jgi:hypothetical protein
MGMDIVVKAIGIIIVLMAILYIVKPGVIRRLLEFFGRGSRIYVTAALRVGLAIIFLVAARECKKPWVIFAFGILFLASAFLILLLGSQRLAKMLEWARRQSDLFLRVIALVTLFVGLVIIIYA